jgi:hypothetical protein
MHPHSFAPDEYRHLAAECVRVAQDTDDPTSKVQLLQMALSWIELGELATEDSGDGPRVKRSRWPGIENSTGT